MTKRYIDIICSQCHLSTGLFDKYCRNCGAKNKVKIIIEKFDEDMIACLYGVPAPSIYRCKKCGYTWKSKYEFDYYEYCPKCGNKLYND